MSQAELSLILHEAENRVVHQRAEDGYINATEMCQAWRRRVHDYLKLDRTRKYREALSVETGYPVSQLAQQVRGVGKAQGTWIHPWLAVDLAQWLSPKFQVQVNKWVYEWMSGQVAREGFPDHIRRYAINQAKIPPTHFSMLNQMTFRLLGPLEIQGYIVPAKLMPDISLGKMFSGWLRKRDEDPDSFPTYPHEFLPDDPRPTVMARLYPNRLITDFNRQLDKWLRDGRARKYLGERDPDAILPLDRVLAALPPGEAPEG